MRGKIVLAGLILALSGGAASAQNRAAAPYPNDVYCSGVVTTEAVPRDSYIITGEESNLDVVFSDHDYVFINKGTSKGREGGRPVLGDSARRRHGQGMIGRSGNPHSCARWERCGRTKARVKVVDARPDVSIAQIVRGCGYMQRGDIVLPFVERPEPPIKAVANFDRFAPADGKALAMVITARNSRPQVGRNDIVYVNLGNGQGVKVGDYFRIFRYTGTQNETAFQTRDYAFNMDGDLGPSYGYGGVSKKHNWSNVPGRFWARELCCGPRLTLRLC
jgi:hypothetical protein